MKFKYKEFVHALSRQTGTVTTPESLDSRTDDMAILQEGINDLNNIFGPKAPNTFLVECPKTVEEAVALLNCIVSAEDREYIRSIDNQKELVMLHSSMGRQIRNEFGLWDRNKDLLSDTGEAGDPDGASMVIIREYWESLQ